MKANGSDEGDDPGTRARFAADPGRRAVVARHARDQRILHPSGSLLEDVSQFVTKQLLAAG